MHRKSFFVGFGTALVLVAVAFFFISATQADQIIGTLKPSEKMMIEKLAALEEKLLALTDRTARIEETTAQTFKDLHKMWKELFHLCSR